VLNSIPATAGSAQVFRFDFAALANEIRNIIGAMEPNEGAANFDRAIGAGQMYLGANPMADILEPLGDTWTLYTDESLAGNGQAGNVLVNKLDDAEKAKRGFGALWRVAQNFARARGAGMGVTLDDETVENVAVQVIRTPQFSFAWTINNGNLVFAAAPATVVKASALVPKSGLDQNPAFVKLTQQLTQSNKMTSFRFMDLPKTADARNAELSKGWTLIHALAAQQGFSLPDEILPPLAGVQPHLAPAGEVAWTSDTGFYSRSSLPFPGADIYSGGPNAPMMQAGGSALAISILLPSLNRARETANRVKCASNERQIGQAILLYSNDNKGNYPPDLGTLILTQDITAEQFICPSGNTSLPKDWQSLQPQQAAEWVNGNSDFIYAGQGLRNDAPAEQIVLLEKLADHDRDGLNCLFGDGHVEFIQPSDPRWEQVQELINKHGK
jgi:prepilin-type processing-associated H-X9-DG protein